MSKRTPLMSISTAVVIVSYKLHVTLFAIGMTASLTATPMDSREECGFRWIMNRYHVADVDVGRR